MKKKREMLKMKYLKTTIGIFRKFKTSYLSEMEASSARPLLMNSEREDKVAQGVLAGDWEVSFDGGPFQGFDDFGCCSVIDRDQEAFLGDVQGEVLAHCGNNGEADSGQSGGHHLSRAQREVKFGLQYEPIGLILEKEKEMRFTCRKQAPKTWKI